MGFLYREYRYKTQVQQQAHEQIKLPLEKRVQDFLDGKYKPQSLSEVAEMADEVATAPKKRYLYRTPTKIRELTAKELANPNIIKDLKSRGQIFEQRLSEIDPSLTKGTNLKPLPDPLRNPTQFQDEYKKAFEEIDKNL